MKTYSRSLAWVGVLAVGALGLGASEAKAQGFGFTYASPGFGLSVGRPAYYPPAYPVYAPPVVAPVVVAPPFYGPRPYYGGGYGYAYGPRPYYGGGYYGHPHGGPYRRW